MCSQLLKIRWLATSPLVPTYSLWGLNTTYNKLIKPVKQKSEKKYFSLYQLDVIVAGLPDLARLVHGNSRSIQKLVREFCEFWRRKSMPDNEAGDTGSDENAQVVKVSKRKAEAKIREIAVYELRPQCYKHKLWYVNDKVLEKLELSLPVPTEWKWITLTSAVKSTEVNTASVAKQSVSVSSVQASTVTTNGTIKSFMSPMTSNGSNQQSPAGNSVNVKKDSHGMGQSPALYSQQASSEITSNIEYVSSSSPVCIPVVCDSSTAAGAKRGCENPVQPFSTPCSSSGAKKRKVQSVRRCSLPTKQQPCLLFRKKPQQPAKDDNCMVVVDSCSAKCDDNVPSADKTRAETSDLGAANEVKTSTREPAGDSDCMIVDPCVFISESDTRSNASEECAELDGGAVAVANDVCVISDDDKSLPGTDANSNLCVVSSASDANRPAEATDIVDN